MAVIAITLSGCQMAADGHNLDGVRLYHQGHYTPALQQFQEALAANPDNADAYYNMAATLHKQGIQNNDPKLLQEAETLYNTCLDFAPDHVDCHRGLAVLLVETDRSDRAFKLLENWVMSSPNVADARIELARLYQEFGDLDVAKEHLNKALVIDQQNPRAWAALGQIREQLGEYDQALANYQRSLQLNRFQKGIEQRVAQLNQALRTQFAGGTSGNTRTVTLTSGGRY